jgi:hypothetical protein
VRRVVAGWRRHGERERQLCIPRVGGRRAPARGSLVDRTGVDVRVVFVSHLVFLAVMAAIMAVTQLMAREAAAEYRFP